MLLSGQGVSVAGGGEWDPRSIADLVTDMDSRVNVATSGSNVTQWTAARGLAYVFDPAATTPQYEASGWVGSRQTLPCITTNGLNDRLESTNTVGGIALANRLLGGTDQPGTVLLVYQMMTLGQTSGLVAFTKTGLTFADRSINFTMIDDTGHHWRCRKRDDSITNKVADSGTVTHDTSKHIMAWASSGTLIEQRQDNAPITLSGTPAGDWDVGLVTVDRVELAAVYGGSPADMRIARVLFYSRQLTSGELDAAYSGLNQIYG